MALIFSDCTVAAAPTLYQQPANESAVRGDPDDLLLLAGYELHKSDVVFYQIGENLHAKPPSPDVQSHPGPDSGVAAVVSTLGVPYSLTVRLPDNLRGDRTYRLWARTVDGEWSNPVLVNDPRPLWFTPAYVYDTGTEVSQARGLTIVGRNLDLGPGHTAMVRLDGPQTVVSRANTGESSGARRNRYVLRLELPPRLAVGKYRVSVNRDDAGWTDIPEQTLDVLPHRTTHAAVSIDDPRFGNCHPNDGLDDTSCIRRAIDAAQKAGSGTVFFPPGTWDLIGVMDQGTIDSDGIVIPAGVSLRGAGSARTQVLRHQIWSSAVPRAAFTLTGDNAVTDFTFRDEKQYGTGDSAASFLRLGVTSQIDPAAAHLAVQVPTVFGVVISRNVFDKTFIAIGTGGLPISRLFVSGNIFGAFNSALELTGNRYNTSYPYRLDDSVVTDNTFKPGSSLDVAGKAGTIASEIGAGRHLYFSGNNADGASTDFLYSKDDAKGWRAAFFWNMDNNLEDVLVENNMASCTGDKIGDGEAFGFDNNANTFGFESAASIVSSDQYGVTTAASLAHRQNDRDVPADSYYIGDWIQVVAGPGVGQARKVVSYSQNPESHQTVFRVTPAWDVPPIPGKSRITVGREFWQLYVVNNTVDNRKPLCQKSNRSRSSAGSIGLWAQSADSVIEGNRQFDSDGIYAQANYIVPEHPCADCTMIGFIQSFLEIRDNLVDGEYDWDTDCSASGIALGVAAAPWGREDPPTVGFGVSISHNTVRHADAYLGGAIAQLGAWFAGPAPHNWPLSDSVLIYHNSITDISGAPARAKCTSKAVPRIGIAFPEAPIAWHSVLYGNTCSGVSRGVGPSGARTVNLCPASPAHSCECP